MATIRNELTLRPRSFNVSNVMPNQKTSIFVLDPVNFNEMIFKKMIDTLYINNYSMKRLLYYNC